ncbi:MAG TPA: DinB family protein [Chloroflexota bacterium]|nr:DinB family protein [Chloroflexota bacterium]HUM69823.1 DinB family protein [Chloroflexota bacterium]
MLDFARVRLKEITWAELTAGLTVEDLRDLTNEMVDTMLALLADCTDECVTLVPYDPAAHDAYAVNQDEVGLAWTLGHVIVHTTASAEESAALAAELARGVVVQPRRSRSERPWRTISTIAQCRHRLEESRRMRLASLDMWPDEPYLDNYYQAREGGVDLTAVIRFVLGLSHDDSHLGQIQEIVRQAQATLEPA